MSLRLTFDIPQLTEANAAEVTVTKASTAEVTSSMLSINTANMSDAESDSVSLKKDSFCSEKTSPVYDVTPLPTGDRKDLMNPQFQKWRDSLPPFSPLLSGECEKDTEECPPKLMSVSPTLNKNKKVDYYTSLKSLVSSELKETNKVSFKKPPLTKQRWGRMHRAQIEEGKDVLYSWSEHGFVARATPPCISTEKPDENAYDESLSAYVKTRRHDKLPILGDFIVTDAHTETAPGNYSSSSQELMVVDEVHALNDLVIVTRAKAKLIASRMPQRKKAFLEKATLEFIMSLNVLIDKEGDLIATRKTCSNPKSNFAETHNIPKLSLSEVMDRTKECKVLLCKHQLKIIVDKFIRNIFQSAEKVLSTLTPCQMENFDSSIRALVGVIEMSYDHYSPRLFPPLCDEEDCPHKDNSSQDITSKAKIFGGVVTTSDPIISYTERYNQLLTNEKLISSNKAVQQEMLKQCDQTLDNLSKVIYKEVNEILETLPNSETRILKRAIKSFMREIRNLRSEMQTDEIACGCTNWFKRYSTSSNDSVVEEKTSENESNFNMQDPGLVVQKSVPEAAAKATREKQSDNNSDGEFVIIQPEDNAQNEINNFPMGIIDIIPMEVNADVHMIAVPNNNFGPENLSINRHDG